jgi:chromosome segregation ATPase
MQFIEIVNWAELAFGIIGGGFLTRLWSTFFTTKNERAAAEADFRQSMLAHINSLSHEVQSSREDRQKLHDQLHNLERENLRLSQRVHELELEKDEIKGQYTTLQNQHDQLKKAHDDLKKKFNQH